MKNILTIVGARPQFVKAAVVSKALSEIGINETIIHTGQHYDYEMSTVFWEELNLPSPSVNLEVGSGLHGAQTGLMLEKIERYILNLESKPDALIVYGDTNSTIAGALVASKLHIPVIHIEAGLRSFNREMPEEINRVVTDHISTLLFCSSNEGVQQLEKEGISENVFNVGDVMYDAILTFSEISSRKYSLNDLVQFGENEFYLATIHRPSNTDSEENLNEILTAFSNIDAPVVWPVHPRNRKKLRGKDVPRNIYMLEPVSYFKMITLLKNCRAVLTDSGGLQKEAYWMKKPCITIREETEWVETLHGGWNQITGASKEKIVNAVKTKTVTIWKPLYGDGKAAKAIASELNEYFKI
ncbi:MAG: UDP-N-acetylglucosamine 2-epimerase (non-hydrolyzing) [Balneolaceae bacterium]|nr:UDP-N-acetylglucosamine 2-epimerase (non-hydrolyzing) [Balneolaceae bacterium]MBO6546050.1 UDP-N-acetylglucosamine 2-epimerase (non-hydrolyzing) [Balneolaceae bacterium]MBO6647446.1 UDP-N-acetylglucosamine 2-epimerase (non-hydrolyzing) [Balneolaceae bacterium]